MFFKISLRVNASADCFAAFGGGLGALKGDFVQGTFWNDFSRTSETPDVEKGAGTNLHNKLFSKAGLLEFFLRFGQLVIEVFLLIYHHRE